MFSNLTLRHFSPSNKTENSRLYAQFYDVALKEAISKLEIKDPIKTEALSSLYENLAKVLDKVVMNFINTDLKKYRERKGIQINKLSEQEMSTLFDEYLNSFSTGGTFSFFKKNNFKQILTKQYPAIEEMINQICLNFTQNTNQAFSRIVDDLELLEKNFLQGMSNPYLSKIISTGSDFHKQGQQVLILVFTDDNEKQRKIVYKPSSVLADAMIVGDLKKLSEIDPDYKNQKSMSEIINESAKKESHKVGSYLVVPRLDGDPNNICSHYGYIEFVEHTSVPDIDLETMVKDNPNYINDEIRQLHKKFFKALIESGGENHCILKSMKSLEDYSYSCGRLIAMMQLLGLTDVHCENLIIHEHKPFLIDTEACFSLLSIPSTEQMGCFQSDQGAFNGDSRKDEYFYFLRDIKGITSVWCTSPSSNQIVYVDEDKGRAIIGCHPDSQHLLSGYKDMLEEYASNPKDILAWFDQEKVKNMRIRVLPKSTSEYANTIQVLFSKGFSEKEYDALNEKQISKNKKIFDANFTHYQTNQVKENCSAEDQKEHIEFHIAQAPLPGYCCDLSKNLFQEYRSLSIPYFHASVAQNQLFDAKNAPVPIKATVKDKSNENESEENTQFFPETPIKMTLSRAKTIAQNEQLRVSMLSEVSSMISQRLNSEPLIIVAIDHITSIEKESDILESKLPDEITERNEAEITNISQQKRDEQKKYKSMLSKEKNLEEDGLRKDIKVK